MSHGSEVRFNNGVEKVSGYGGVNPLEHPRVKSGPYINPSHHGGVGFSEGIMCYKTR